MKTELRTGAAAAEEIARLTGVAMTPLLGLTFVGALRWFRASESARARLPFHQQPWFFGTGLALIVVFFLGHRVPVVDRAFKSLKTVENKLSGLLALPIVSTGLATVLAPATTSAVASLNHLLLPSAWAAGGSGGAGIVTDLGFDLAWLVSAAIAAAVWLAGHTINVLAMVSPAAPVDWLLKGSKSCVIGGLAAATTINPWLGLVVSLILIVVAVLIAGWSFRLMVFGWVFATDTVFFRSRWTSPSAQALWCFTTSSFTRVPPRTYGRIFRVEGQLRFDYRPWMALPRRSVELGPEASFVVERGLASPVLLQESVVGDSSDVLRFPPRFRPHAQRLSALLGGLRVRDAAVVRGLRAAIAWVQEQVGRGAARLRAGVGTVSSQPPPSSTAGN